MKLLERRTPPAWPLIIAASIFAVLLVYALYSGDAFVPGRRGEPSRHILRGTEPDRFLHYIRFFSVAAAIGWFVGFVRLVPIENTVRTISMSAKERISRRGYDRDSSPWWGYLILVAAIALVIWIGKVTMYSS